MTIIIISCWSHFSFVHQNLTHGTMRIFCDFFWKYWYPLSIVIIHFRWSWIMTSGTIKIFVTWRINWNLETNIYMYLGRLVHSHS
jgi:hypothetical protein